MVGLGTKIITFISFLLSKGGGVGWLLGSDPTPHYPVQENSLGLSSSCLLEKGPLTCPGNTQETHRLFLSHCRITHHFRIKVVDYPHRGPRSCKSTKSLKPVPSGFGELDDFFLFFFFPSLQLTFLTLLNVKIHAVPGQGWREADS